ncbi:MAG: hydrogenase iron-sulfur subunit [Candidatus Fermentibacter sp.]|nr:hydrogenase iron-sulfur subunit [Candidatus Fermentibacter sp.]
MTGTNANAGWEPRIVAFLCNWCSYAGADSAGVGRMQYPASVRVIRVPCAGRINPFFILSAFRSGADGVLVSGCHPGDCHYISGNLGARRKFALLARLLGHLGIEEGRLHFTWVSASEGGRFAEVIETVTTRVRELGSVRRNAGGAR